MAVTVGGRVRGRKPKKKVMPSAPPRGGGMGILRTPKDPRQTPQPGRGLGGAAMIKSLERAATASFPGMGKPINQARSDLALKKWVNSFEWNERKGILQHKKKQTPSRRRSD